MASPLKAFIDAACKELQQVDDAEACAQLLKRTAEVLRLSADDLVELGSPSTDAAEALVRLEAYERLLIREGGSGTQQQVFGRPYDYLAEVLLSGTSWRRIQLVDHVDYMLGQQLTISMHRAVMQCNCNGR